MLHPAIIDCIVVVDCNSIVMCNVAVADYSDDLDVNCLIKNGLMKVSEKIVIFGVTKLMFEFAGTEPDYLVYVQDYSKNESWLF